jgi:hypothetical protein
MNVESGRYKTIELNSMKNVFRVQQFCRQPIDRQAEPGNEIAIVNSPEPLLAQVFHFDRTGCEIDINPA